MNTKFDIGQRVTYTVRHEAKIDGIQIKRDGTVTYSAGGRMIAERDLNGTDAADKKSEESTEPIKLYCVKSDTTWLTKGKIYEATPDFRVKYDNGFVGNPYESIEDFHKWCPDTGELLFPLVKRPAKIGEWVLATSPDHWHSPDVTVNSVLKCDGDNSTWRFGRIGVTSGNILHDREYLVLDGYHGEAES